VLALAACGGGGTAARVPTSARVVVADYAFAPTTIHVRAGGRVTWVNRDSTAHTATASAGFDSGTIRERASGKPVVFRRAGTFVYICQFHPYMHGTVVVSS